MSSKAEIVVNIEITQSREGFAATTDLGGTPICCYGTTEDEAERRAKGATLRLLGSVVERGHAKIETVRFRTQE